MRAQASQAPEAKKEQRPVQARDDPGLLVASRRWAVHCRPKLLAQARPEAKKEQHIMSSASQDPKKEQIVAQVQ